MFSTAADQELGRWEVSVWTGHLLSVFPSIHRSSLPELTLPIKVWLLLVRERQPGQIGVGLHWDYKRFLHTCNMYEGLLHQYYWNTNIGI